MANISKTKVSLLPTIAPATLEDPQLLVETVSPGFVCWCPRRRCGGLWDATSSTWMLVGPISFDSFVGLIEGRGVRIASTPAEQLWRDRVHQVRFEVEQPRPRHDA